uniref:Solute carrier family 22 member 13b n=1 Tax=Oreochromis niloticus TaxID=8128 RepID=A0A669CJC9_ORENI
IKSLLIFLFLNRNKPLCVILVYFTALEWTDPSKSAFCTMSIIAFFAVGQILLAGIAYLIQNWRILQLVLFCPLVIVLVAFYRLLPESEEALKELQRAARVNKKKVPEDVLNNVNSINTENFGNFGLNIYLTQLIFAVVEIPANLCGLTLIQRFGRRICQACFLLFGGAACLVVLAVPKDLSMVVTVLAVLGKFSATASFSTAYVYTAELYPTVLRQNGVGLNSMCARVAGIVAPLIRMTLLQFPACIEDFFYMLLSHLKGASCMHSTTYISALQYCIQTCERKGFHSTLCFCAWNRCLVA